MAEPATYRPTSPDELTALVAWAVGEEQKLEVVGNGSKRGLGRPVEAAHRLELAGLTGIAHVRARRAGDDGRAGTPLAQIEAELAECRQELASSPPTTARILGGEPGRPDDRRRVRLQPRRPAADQSRGGARPSAGPALRHRPGPVIKTGGRVVKNVTGYDLCKLLTGSYGTLAVLSEVTFKVLPRAETRRTLL